MDKLISALVALALAIALIYLLIIGLIWLVGQLMMIGFVALLVGLPMVLIMLSVFLAAWIYFRSKLLDPHCLLQSLPVDTNCNRMDFDPDGDALFDAVDFTSIRAGLTFIVLIYVGIHAYLLTENHNGHDHTQVMLGTFAAGLGAIPLIVNSKAWMQASLRATTTNALQRGEGCFADLRRLGEIATEIKEMYLSLKITDISSFGGDLAARLHSDDDILPREKLERIIDWALSERNSLQACIDEFAVVNTRFRSVSGRVNRVSVGSFLVVMDELYCVLGSEEMLAKLKDREWEEFSGILGGILLEMEAIEQRIDEIESGGNDQQDPVQPDTNEMERLCAILGVNPVDDFRTMKKHVNQLRFDLHPDHNEQATNEVKRMGEERLKHVNNAWDRLKELLGK